MKRQTLAADPLDAVVPTKGSRKAQEAPRGPARVAKERLTIHITVDLVERVKNAVYWTPGLTLAGFAEEALLEAVGKAEKLHRGAFEKRKANLKGGRPMK